MVREGKSLQHKNVSGRPRVITYSQKQSIIRTLNCYPKMSTRSLHANLSSKLTDTPSKSTVYRATRACGFDFRSPVIGPFITDETAKKRVEWCKIHKKREWANVFFTDECSIWLNRGTEEYGPSLKKIQFQRFKDIRRSYMYGGVFHPEVPQF